MVAACCALYVVISVLCVVRCMPYVEFCLWIVCCYVYCVVRIVVHVVHCLLDGVRCAVCITCYI